MQGAILVTGANGGIGHHVLEHLLAEGHRNIFCHYRSNDDRVRNTLESAGLNASKHSAAADLTSEESIANLESAIKASFPGVSCLINIAGSSSNGMSWKLTKDTFQRVIDDSLLSTFLCTRQFVPYMREQGFGRIINLSSIVGFTGVAGAAHYAAAKAGIIGFTKSVALELASKGITANALALGYFDAGLIESVPEEIRNAILQRIPAGRFGNQEDVGAAVNYLISKQAQFYNGQVLHLNGGQY